MKTVLHANQTSYGGHADHVEKLVEVNQTIEDLLVQKKMILLMINLIIHHVRGIIKCP